MTQRFYRISDDKKRSAVHLLTDVELDPCTLLDDSSKLRTNNLMRVDKGKKFYDVLPFAEYLEIAVSDRFIRLLEENEVRGWGSFPLKIDGHTDQQYHAFYPLSQAGPILNRGRDGISLDPIIFDESTIQGVDIFTLQGTTLTICTEEVKELIEKAGITNVEFSDL